MATKKYDLVIGKKGKDGRTYWKNIGVVFENEKGHLSGLIEWIPPNWNGWFSLFVPKEKQQHGTGASSEGEEIPF